MKTEKPIISFEKSAASLPEIIEGGEQELLDFLQLPPTAYDPSNTVTSINENTPNARKIKATYKRT